MTKHIVQCTDLLEEVGERQSTRQERLRQHLESNPDILLPLLNDLSETEGRRESQESSKTSGDAWTDQLREDNPGLTEAQLRRIAQET